MPIGKINSKTGFVGSSYNKDPMTKYVQSFTEFAKNLLNESGMDIFEEPKKILRRPATKEALKEFFCSNFFHSISKYICICIIHFINNFFNTIRWIWIIAIKKHNIFSFYIFECFISWRSCSMFIII